MLEYGIIAPDFLWEPCFQIFGCLVNEYIVDMFSYDLESWLTYIRFNQVRLRQTMLHSWEIPI